MADEEKEPFSWKKFFTGLINPLNTAKVTAHYLHLALIVALVFFGLKAGLWVKNWLFPVAQSAPAVSAPQQIDAKDSAQVDASKNKESKSVDESNNKSVKNGLINLSLFGK